MTTAVLSLGSNLGDRRATLQGAVEALVTGPGALRARALSPVFETEPVGGPDQGAFLNAVLVVETEANPYELLARARRTERDHARVRGVRWGPRTLDVDVVVFGRTRSQDPELTLPHPRAHERAFVLRPWLEVDPEAEIPGRGRAADLLARIDGQGLRLREDLALVLPQGD